MATELALVRVCWVSIDPVTCAVDFYPSHIAELLETEFASQRVDPLKPTSCKLGVEFFNATVHFHKGCFYQTTPKSSDREKGFKPSGYRSVQRVDTVTDGDLLTLWAKEIHGEYRLTDADDTEYKGLVTAVVPKEAIVLSHKQSHEEGTA